MRWGITMTSFAALAASLAIPDAAMAQDIEPLQKGDTIVRLRAILVAPQDDSGDIEPSLPGEGVKVTSSVTPEIDFTYMVTNNIGLELIAATSKHDFKGVSGVTGSIGKLGSTWALPPTLTLNYHFNNEGKIRPYLGAGINYTIFYSDKASGGLEDAVGPTSVDLDDSFGIALHAGVDVAVSKNMMINFDAKWIDMDTTATLDTTALGVQKVDVEIDPLVLGVGIGWKF